MTRSIDFGRAAADYAGFRQGLPDEAVAWLHARGVGSEARALDVGTGTGQMARRLAAGGARVVGLDPSHELLRAGGELDARAGLALGRVRGRAEELPFSSGSFDLVTAAQCWHWLDAERAAAEALRLLAPGGRLALVHLDWLPLAGNVVAATEALILAHNPRWHLGGGDGRYPDYGPQLAAAGFEDVRLSELDLDLSYTHAGWRGRIRASAGVAAALAPGAVERFDREHAALLAERFPDDPLPVPHRVFAAVGTRR
ncbi:MAG: methyltransferase domain-containing protein [Planctomycetota bacterium]